MNRLIYFPAAMLLAVSSNAASLPVVEAESGTLGGEFTVSTLDGADNITISTMPTANNPGSAARVASYAVQFPSADTYQLYARVRVGPGNYTDDSFFYGNGFGAKSPTTDSNWVAVVNGVNTTGFTAATDVVTVGGGTAATQVWKWMKFSTLFTVPSGSLTQTFQVGGREDGFHGQVCLWAIQCESHRGGTRQRDDPPDGRLCGI